MMKKTFLVVVALASFAASWANPFELNAAKQGCEQSNLLGLGALESESTLVEEPKQAANTTTVESKKEEKISQNDTKVEDVAKKSKRPAKITAKRTFYDRKEGVAYFEGNVCVDDEQYKMNADKVYVFLDGTNDLRRIVAIGNVAMTNEMRRAYASKASYYKRNGMVVLDSGSGITAEVRDESKKEDTQSVRGKKIKFWLSSEQVEVIDADITAPSAGAKGGLGSIKKDVLGK